MAVKAGIKQVWECPKCHRRYESPIGVSEVTCSNSGGHPRGKPTCRMTHIWSSSDGGSPPPPPTEGAV